MISWGGNARTKPQHKAPKVFGKQLKRTVVCQFDAPKHEACQTRAAQLLFKNHHTHKTTNLPSEPQPDGQRETPGQVRACIARYEQRPYEERGMTEWDKQQDIPLSNGTRTSSIAPPRDVKACQSNATANAKPAHHPSNPLYTKEWGLVPLELPAKTSTRAQRLVGRANVAGKIVILRRKDCRNHWGMGGPWRASKAMAAH
ncbi:hypothetical protein NC651_021474 [Populus alba x Populus x berolinensis]|nr:hypothetical protein NC651_021474 [Populus alba x Populus x berolinensis]